MQSERGEVQIYHPGEMVRKLLKERGWTQDDLALITGRSVKAISDVVRGRSGISPEMAMCLAAAFGNTEAEWMQAESTYRLSLLSCDTSDIGRRAELFRVAPIIEMQRRGWIKGTSDLAELERELAGFFRRSDISSADVIAGLSVAARRTAKLPGLTPAETAWCFRAKQLASTLLAAPFSPSRISRLKRELRRLAAHPREARHISKVLADYGIRFVVVEPLSGVRIDGACFWDEIGPVIAVSLRHDRMDGVWFTIMHEIAHVEHGDSLSVDTAMVDPVNGVIVRLAEDDAESRADEEAAASLIPTSEIESFIGRVGPLYSKDRIIQFANRIRIHPAIIVGQLQYRSEIGYGAMRDLMAKVRDNVIGTALTDGWNQTISPAATGRKDN
jgi:HTH-type transcriptional regulator/antitoxin HigA